MILAHPAVLSVALVNVAGTAWLMFISPHDLGLLTLLLFFSAALATTGAATLAALAARRR